MTERLTTNLTWKEKDEQFAYDGPLGPVLNSDGTAVLRLWSPSAKSVQVLLYDKDNQEKQVAVVEMNSYDKGLWEVTLNQETVTGIDNFNNYCYHYQINREDETVLALDPYAKSLGTWNSHDEASYIAKAAIVAPENIGQKLDFAKVENYKRREDAVIYEVHVRDFTSDPSIKDELHHRFGTFEAMTERLDYIQSLGVTHVQLLPVLSYYHANEYETGERFLEYKSAWTNYNWGYDPMHYFALTGMYSINPEDPSSRIKEFKELVNEIHKRGMAVTLDVVYNHTAELHILEDLEPEYYHFMDSDGTSRTNFGGGRLGSTHYMTRRLIIDSLKYLVEEFKVDGFRFDMMGDLDAETVQLAYDETVKINPNILMIGEGWITYVGDEGAEHVQAADQLWMSDTEAVGSFSDEIRDELKSGFQSEGKPRFITGGRRNVQKIFDNIKGQPHNFEADQPGDVVQYIEAHDNLTLHDVIAQSINKDPILHTEEIHQRIRLGNLIVLTSQGTAFIHAGQEYGRTKQFKHPEFKTMVDEWDDIPDNSTYFTNNNGDPIEYPYFIHDSYDSSDAINKFEWEKVRGVNGYSIESKTMEHMRGLIQLRQSTDAFRLANKELIDTNVQLLNVPEIRERDVAIAYKVRGTNGDEYIIVINGNKRSRMFTLPEDVELGQVIADQNRVDTEPLMQPQGIEILSSTQIKLAGLSSVIFKK